MCEKSKQANEVRIDVPWGFLTAKTWGDESNQAVLCFHGFMDNASTFNRLIEFLPEPFFYISVDLPGHGFSSHFPPHLPIMTQNYVSIFKILAIHFKRDQYIIMGHSLGAQLVAIFAQMYPQRILKAILIDSVTFFSIPSQHYHRYIKDKFENFLRMEEKLAKRKPPTYTYQEAIKKLIHGRDHGPLSNAAAIALSERALKQVEQGRYAFTLDTRLKFMVNPSGDIPYIIEGFMKYPIRCPALIILTQHFEEHIAYMSSVIEFLGRSDHIIIRYVDANHDVHINEPEKISPLIAQFLMRQKGSL